MRIGIGYDVHGFEAGRRLVLGGVGAFFWAFVFAVIYRMLLYFRGTQGIGDLLAAKLLATSLTLGSGGSGGEDRLTENVTFNFAEVKRISIYR